MRVICVDDEELVLKRIISLCTKISLIDEVKGFLHGGAALEWLDDHSARVALLDINMQDMNGLVLAAHIRKKSPETRIVFLTGFPQYAVDAFAMHATGYLLKPVSMDNLAKELAYAASVPENPYHTYAHAPAHVEVHTFGRFWVKVDGVLIHFNRAKAKELLAYLVERNGDYITRKEVFAVLWEEQPYDRSKQKYLDTVIRDMRKTLKEHGISEIFELYKGRMRIRPQYMECDLYRFWIGDVGTVNDYRGEYMEEYSWADLMRAQLSNGQ